MVVLLVMGLPAIREFYDFIEGPSTDAYRHNKLGPFAWLGFAVRTLLLLIIQLVSIDALICTLMQKFRIYC